MEADSSSMQHVPAFILKGKRKRSDFDRLARTASFLREEEGLSDSRK